MPEFDPLRAKVEVDADDALRSMNGMIGAVGNFRAALGAGSAALVAFGAALAVREAIQFEAAMANVAKTVDATEDEIAALADALVAMAARIPVSSAELAELASIAGQLGVEVQNIEKFTETAAALGVATNLSAERAAEALAQLSNILGTSQEDFDRLGSAVVDLGNNSAATESRIVEMSLRIAGAGRLVGLTEGEVVGFAAALSSVGIEAEAGGTAISRVMRDISSAVKGGGAALEQFALIAGTSSEEFRRSFEQDAAGAIVEFIRGLRGIIDAGGDVNAVLESVSLNDIRVSDTLLRAAQATDLFRGSLDRGNTAFAANVAIAEEASRFYGTTAAQLEITKNRFSDLAAEIGTNLLGVVVATIQKTNTLLGLLARITSLLSDDAREPRGLERFETAIDELGRRAGVSRTQVEQLDEGVRKLASELRGDVQSQFFDQVAELIRRTATAGNLESVARGIRNLFEVFPRAGQATGDLGRDIEGLLERLRELATEGDKAAEAVSRIDESIGPPRQLFTAEEARIRDQVRDLAAEIGGPIGQALRNATRDAEGWRDRIRQIATIAGGPLAEALRDLVMEQRLNLELANELPSATDAYADSLDRAKREAEEHRREVLELVDAIEASVRGAIDLGQAFGAIGPEVASILNSATSLGSAISGIATATSFGQALPFVGQAFGAGANLIAGVFGESAGERRIREATEQNTIALERVKGSLDQVADAFDRLAGETISAADRIAEIEPGQATDPSQRGTGIEALGQSTIIRDALAAAGVTVVDIERIAQAAGGIEVDQLLRLITGADLTFEEMRIAVLQFEALQEAAVQAANGANSFSAQMERLRREFELFDIDDPIKQLDRMRRLFLEFVKLPDDVEAAIAGADLSTPEGRAAFEAALQRAFELLGIDPSLADKLSGPEAEAFLEEMKRASDALEGAAGGADGAASEGFRSVRTITEAGANLMIAVLTTIAITLDQIKAIEEAQLVRLGGEIPASAGGRLPTGLAGVVDPAVFTDQLTELRAIRALIEAGAASLDLTGAASAAIVELRGETNLTIGDIYIGDGASITRADVAAGIREGVLQAVPELDRAFGARRIDADFFSGRQRRIE